MKKTIAMLLSIIMLIAATGSMPVMADEIKKPPVLPDREFRGVWVASVYNLDYPSKPGLNEAELKKEADTILNDALETGFNAVFLQVRPTGDALYKSSLFPWSDYLSTKQGQAPQNGFDPLKYWIDQAHARGIELHAWVNPYRITRGSEKSPKHDLSALASANPARKNPSWTVKYKDGNLYYNPGIPEARTLVIDGVREIVKNYDVDGIHFDDYFYPGSDFPDSAAYKKYGGSFKNINDWRRDNVDKLIKGTYDAVKAIKPDVSFGVSPFGIWANKSENSFGSDTNGQQSYYAHYADSRKWVKSGWLDYICPQIYWNIGYKIADYEKLLKWWADVVSGTDVDLYIGQAAYRSGSTTANDPWQGTDEIIRQLDMNKLYPQVKGTVQYRYGSFNEYRPLLLRLKEYFYDAQSKNNPLAVMPSRETDNILMVGRPASNITTTLSKYYVLGSSDPSKPLYLNGKLVENRSASGYFGVYTDLKTGDNELVFTQGGQTVKRVIKRSSGSSSGASAMSKAEIVSGSAYPNIYDEYKKPGETITLKCTAPVGASVSVKIAGKTYKMTPATSGSAGKTLYATTYSYKYTIPSYKDTGKIITVGTPVYTMTLNGKTSSRTASGIVKCITPGAPYFAAVTSDTAFIYNSNTTSGGPAGELSKGMRDYITAVTDQGKWVRLGMGKWIQLSDVKRTNETSGLSAKIENTVYTAGDKWDTVKFELTAASSVYTSYDGKNFSVTVYNVSNAPEIKIPYNSHMSTVTGKLSGTKAEYIFTPKTDAGMEGYYTEADGKTLTVYIKRKPALKAGTKPLTGISVMLDAGHGGSDPGAIGPLGNYLPEKTIALSATLKLKTELERLGASVTLTRSGDTYLSLQDRLAMSRRARPDMFFSIHVNSMGEDVNSSTISGVSTWYMNSVSKRLAALSYENGYTLLDRGKRGTHQSNLYVCRGAWCPSIIFEIGFISSPSEYEWLISNERQDELVNNLANSIVKYFE